MTLKIVTPEKVIYDGEINELVVPTVKGEIAILPHHIDLLTQVSEGVMTIKAKGKEQDMAVTGGFLQIVNNTITLLADFAVRSDEINVQKALEAQRRAEDVLKKKKEDISERDFALAQADIRRAVLELKVAKRRRGTQNIPSQS